MAKDTALAITPQQTSLARNIRRHWRLYVMIIPCLAYFLTFKFVPLLGSVIAFTDFRIWDMWNSPWVGLEHFRRLFTYPDFYAILRNTIILSLYLVIFTFPAPIVLAIFLNEIPHRRLQRTIQSFLYLPYFLSWVIIAGIIFDILSADGLVNSIRMTLGAERAVLFMQREEWFRPVVVISTIWRESGWSTIIFLAAISGIDPQLYEAAEIDGAGRIKRIWHITLPGLLDTIVVLFLLRIGNMLELGFDQIYNFLTPMTYSVGDIIETYIYRMGVLGAQYSITTAIGMFQSIVGFLMIFTFDRLAKRVTDRGIF